MDKKQIENESTVSKVDNCISKICDEVSENLIGGYSTETSNMIEALAKLITARASMG